MFFFKTLVKSFFSQLSRGKEMDPEDVASLIPFSIVTVATVYEDMKICIK